MERRISILIILLLTASLYAIPPMKDVRLLFYESVESSQKTNELYAALTQEKAGLNPLYLGYLGATEALVAKHSWNPYNKMDYLKRSQITLGEAIRILPNNLELRFLRFSIQHYLPGFLNASKNLNEDLKMMFQLLESHNSLETDHELLKNVVKFLFDSKRCTPVQEKYLQNKFHTL